MRHTMNLSLYKYRTAAGYSQERLAERSGLSRTSIAMYELREREPYVSHALRIAKALNVSVEDLFKIEEEAL